LTETARITIERDGHVLRIGFNRPEKRNAADYRLLAELALAYGELERDPGLRVGFVFAHGDHFTGGLDLADVGPRIGPDGLDIAPDGGINPWQVDGEQLSKPVVIAVQGTCLTLGIELILASDIAVAAESTRFGQIEVARGILPFGGATIRFPRAVGWGNAMRWILTGDSFDAAEAHRIGLVQEVVPDGAQFERGLELPSPCRPRSRTPGSPCGTATRRRRPACNRSWFGSRAARTPASACSRSPPARRPSSSGARQIGSRE
jgi:enoyl-CoA hydratase